jgi:hypothetical protein
MPSPFPGMDPWLEDENVIRDLQFLFSVRLSGALNAVLPKGYYSTTASRTWWESERRRPVDPDAVIDVRRTDDGPLLLPGVGGFVQTRELYVKVRRIAEPKHKLTATLHVVTAEDKVPGHPARVLFEQGQRNELMSRVNRVEIDLLRAGVRVAAVPEKLARSTGPFDSCVCVYRGRRPAEVTLYPIRLADRLPTIQVPVSRNHADVTVDLQAILDQCYKGGAYDRWIDYETPPDPPLSAEQAEWAAGVLRTKGVIP